MKPSDRNEVRRSINRICDEFEDNWIEDSQPRISDFFPRDIPESDQHELFIGLFELDLDYHRQNELTYDFERLLSGFPHFTDAIRAEMNSVSQENGSESEKKTGNDQNLRHGEDGNPSGSSRRQLDFQRFLEQARNGDQSALGFLLNEYRGYLRLIAEREMGQSLMIRSDQSDVVQKSCIAAVNNFQQFAGETSQEFAAWLVEIHRNKIRDEYRSAKADKRDLDRETSLTDEIEQENSLAPHQRLLDGERAIILAKALDEIPEKQREVVRLRHIEGWSLERISKQLDSKPAAIASLIYRGVNSLREKLNQDLM